MTSIDPTDEQNKAIEAFFRWRRLVHRKPWFYLAGYAGAGKTSIAKLLAADCGKNVAFASYTGKAASILRRKGCEGASTIHKLIYIPVEGNDDRPSFRLRPREEITADIFIIDECSMVNTRLGNDLLNFGIPILVLGDPAQLPPVSGEGFFTKREPDFFLREIHRQAEGSPILKLATMARTGQFINPCRLKGEGGGIAMATKWDNVTEESKLAADQIIVGTNVVRQSLNNKIRASLQASKTLERPPLETPWLPVIGDKVICLRNKHSAGLLNGSQWRVDKCSLSKDWRIVSMRISSLDDDIPSTEVRVPFQCFSGDKNFKFASNLNEKFEEFDYGYAITCHKAQGSEWGNVIVRNQSFIFEEQRHKWLYTAITRASQNLILAA